SLWFVHRDVRGRTRVPGCGQKRGGGGFLDGAFVGVAVGVFELKDLAGAVLVHGFALGTVAEVGVAGDGDVLEVDLVVQAVGHGLFAFAFVVVGFREVVGDADGDGSSGFVVAQADGEDGVADPFAIDGQRGGERAVVVL